MRRVGEIILNEGETVIIKAANGKRMKSIVIDRSGVVKVTPLDPYLAFLTGVNYGHVKVAVATED